MTVSTEINQAGYTGNGVTTVFPFTFRILQVGDLTVTVIAPDDQETVLILGTGYTISGAGGYSGGTVTLPQPLPVSYEIVLQRDMEIVQETDLRNQGTFLAEVHENALDYLTMLIQQVFSSFNLALRKPTFLSRFYDAQQNKISNLGDPSGPQDAVNVRTMRSYVEQMIAGVVGGYGWFIQNFTGAVNRTFQDKMRDILSIKDFGAVGDGVADDTQPFILALSAVKNGGSLRFPKGTYRITAPININTSGGISLIGESSGNTQIIYDGFLNNVEIITLGNSVETFDYKIQNILFDSRIKMVGGYALKLNKISRIKLKDVSFCHIGGSRNLMHGVWFNDLQQGWYNEGELYVQGDGLTVNGNVGTQHGADLWVDKVFAVSCNTGYLIAGGFGGFYIDNGGGFGCGTTVLFDNSKVANNNREILLGDKFVSDGSFENAVHFNDSFANNSPVNISGYFASGGFFGGTGRGIYIEKYAASRINISKAHIFNFKSDAVIVQDTTSLVNISIDTFIDHNTGHAVFSPIINGNIDTFARVYNNAAGDYLNVAGDGVWINWGGANSYPAVGSFGGATTTLRYKKDRRTVFFKCEIQIVNNGTGSNSIYFKLPIQPMGFITIYGNNISTGKPLTGYGSANGDVKLTYYDVTYPAATGNALVIQGHYEI